MHFLIQLRFNASNRSSRLMLQILPCSPDREMKILCLDVFCAAEISSCNLGVDLDLRVLIISCSSDERVGAIGWAENERTGGMR